MDREGTVSKASGDSPFFRLTFAVIFALIKVTLIITDNQVAKK
jgi:hypothetical protein